MEATKGYGTADSRVVAHPSTNAAWRSLTSLFGWEAVLSAQYGRIQRPIRSCTRCQSLFIHLLIGRLL
jgi:hypothetical protein